MRRYFLLTVLLILVIGCSLTSVQSPTTSMLIYHGEWRDEKVAGLWQVMPDGSKDTRLIAPGWYGEYSPDNSQIAYSEPYDNGIWVMKADGTNPVRLTSFGNGSSWSPDGSQLVFHARGTTGEGRYLWIMNADGTDVGQLSTVNGSFGHWSPSGDKIIFHGEVNNGIWLIDPDGSNEELLYRMGGYPAWSPSGEEIAYVDLSDWCIWVMDAGGGNNRKLTNLHGINPAWSADGMRIAYESLEKEKPGLWIINIDGSDNHRINEKGKHPDWSN